MVGAPEGCKAIYRVRNNFVIFSSSFFSVMLFFVAFGLVVLVGVVLLQMVHIYIYMGKFVVTIDSLTNLLLMSYWLSMFCG